MRRSSHCFYANLPKVSWHTSRMSPVFVWYKPFLSVALPLHLNRFMIYYKQQSPVLFYHPYYVQSTTKQEEEELMRKNPKLYSRTLSACIALLMTASCMPWSTVVSAVDLLRQNAGKEQELTFVASPMQAQKAAKEQAKTVSAEQTKKDH